jgi:hypothetical protein
MHMHGEISNSHRGVSQAMPRRSGAWSWAATVAVASLFGSTQGALPPPAEVLRSATIAAHYYIGAIEPIPFTRHEHAARRMHHAQRTPPAHPMSSIVWPRTSCVERMIDHACTLARADHLSPANEFVCDWVRGPLVLGLAQLLKRPDPTGALNHTWTLAYLTRWADHFEVRAKTSGRVCRKLGNMHSPLFAFACRPAQMQLWMNRVLAKHWQKQLGTRTAHCTRTQTLRHSDARCASQAI